MIIIIMLWLYQSVVSQQDVPTVIKWPWRSSGWLLHCRWHIKRNNNLKKKRNDNDNDNDKDKDSTNNNNNSNSNSSN